MSERLTVTYSTLALHSKWYKKEEMLEFDTFFTWKAYLQLQY